MKELLIFFIEIDITGGGKRLDFVW